MPIARYPSRPVRIGSITIGADHPIAVQSMCATKTQDVAATVAQANDLAAAGAGVVRIAVDTPKDADALAAIRAQTQANLSVDLQENYRMAERVAPHVDKIRYNPGHLYHHEKHKPWQDKVRYLADIAARLGLRRRLGQRQLGLPVTAIEAGVVRHHFRTVEEAQAFVRRLQADLDDFGSFGL